MNDNILIYSTPVTHTIGPMLARYWSTSALPNQPRANIGPIVCVTWAVKFWKILLINSFDIFRIAFALSIYVAPHSRFYIFALFFISSSSKWFICQNVLSANLPQMTSRVHRVIYGKTSNSCPTLPFSFSAKTAPCSLKTWIKSSKILKWNVGVSSFRRWRHLPPTSKIQPY